ncbi:hypothetical protein QE152_g22352 [Popillia japonica]|uniref:Uncharacterized protein n=1 Tax=Popillia japonica TaxID=7064 RepID=A0AAW1KM21_POPJA
MSPSQTSHPSEKSWTKRESIGAMSPSQTSHPSEKSWTKRESIKIQRSMKHSVKIHVWGWLCTQCHRDIGEAVTVSRTQSLLTSIENACAYMKLKLPL